MIGGESEELCFECVHFVMTSQVQGRDLTGCVKMRSIHGYRRLKP